MNIYAEYFVCPACGVVSPREGTNKGTLQCRYPDCQAIIPFMEEVVYDMDPERFMVQIEVRVFSGAISESHNLSGDGPWVIGSAITSDIKLNILIPSEHQIRIEKGKSLEIWIAGYDQEHHRHICVSGERFSVGTVEVEIWIGTKFISKDIGPPPPCFLLPEPIDVSSQFTWKIGNIGINYCFLAIILIIVFFAAILMIVFRKRYS